MVEQLINCVYSTFDNNDLIALKTASLLGFVGSIAYGVYDKDNSDIDVLGVYVPRVDHYLGLYALKNGDTIHSQKDKVDLTLHEIRKFVYLCVMGNINLITLLYLPSYCYIKRDALGSLLIRYRDLFLSKQIFRCIRGICTGFRKKVENSYEREDKYDFKRASEIIRILNLGIELSKTGTIVVQSEENISEIKKIRGGAYPYSSMQKYIDNKLNEFEEQMKLSTLPDNVNFDRVNNLLTVAIARHLLPNMMIAMENT